MNIETYNRMVNDELRRCGTGLPGVARARCVECAYDPAVGGSMNEQVDACRCVECPLFPHRPKTGNNPLSVKLADVNLKDNKHQQRRSELIRANQSKSGLRSSVNAFCIDCIFDGAEPGSWREQVGNCKDSNCPIWAVRARSSKS